MLAINSHMINCNLIVPLNSASEPQGLSTGLMIYTNIMQLHSEVMYRVKAVMLYRLIGQHSHMGLVTSLHTV
jgi:hypothetical protein